jgi:hypothetical protein
MRARLTMKLMGIVVMLVLTVVTARACNGSAGSSSPLDPANLAHNGVAGICAEQQAEQAATGQDGSRQTPATVASPSELAQAGANNPGGLQALTQQLGGNLACPTTTSVNP